MVSNNGRGQLIATSARPNQEMDVSPTARVPPGSMALGVPAKIRPVIQAYFRLQPFSDERRAYLEAHPELQHYFSRDDTPTERAMQQQIETYFALPFGPARDEYLAKHAELAAFFDARTAQHDLFSGLAAAFNESDPRMRKFIEMYEDIIPLDAIKQFQLGLHGRKSRQIYQSREAAARTPEKPADSGRRVERNA